jgi:hypothetical protein
MIVPLASLWGCHWPQSSRVFHSAFKQESPALYISNGDAALSAKDYDNAIKLYSAAIDHDSVSDTVFASRCTAKLGEMLWEDALLDAEKVRWYLRFRRPSSMGT